MIDQNKIPLSEPILQGNELKYLKRCIDTGIISGFEGEFIYHFENAVKNYVDIEHAIACINGTSALHIALLLSGIKASDEVIVPTLAFIAPINAVSYCNAQPIFMDCDIETLCLDTVKLEDFLNKYAEIRDDGYAYNKKSQKRIKAIIPVHIFGFVTDMPEIQRIAKLYNIDIIEDAAEALGSKIYGKFAGTFGKLGCCSFNGNKIITSGGGGMILTSDSELASKAKHLINQAKLPGIEYNHDQIGYNYRISNLHAAIGLAQIEQLQNFISIKRQNANLYKERLKDVPKVSFYQENDHTDSNHWFYAISVPKERKNELIDKLKLNNIETRPIWKLIHTLTMYNNCFAYKIENAKSAYETIINLPCSVNLTSENIQKICNIILDSI